MNKKLTSVVLGLSMIFAVPAMADEYEDCLKEVSKSKGGDFELAVCMKAKTDNVLKQVQKEYTTVANMKEFQEWNNGNGMFKGNVRDTYNAWLVHRNKYCDMYAISAKNRAGSDEYNSERCKLDLTNEQLAYIQAIIRNTIATVD